MIELIMVLVILGIISVAFSARFSDTTIFNKRGFHDQTLALLRFAQKAAIAQRRTVCVTFTANSATLNIASTPPPSIICDTDLIGLTGPNQAETTYTIRADKPDVSYSSQPGDFYFNALGQASLSQTIHINGMSAEQNITIVAETGYVYD